MNVAKAGTGTAWLQSLNDEAIAAVADGDEEVTSLAYDGGNSTTARKFNSQDLLEVTQYALEQLAADPDGSAAASGGPSVVDYRSISAL